MQIGTAFQIRRAEQNKTLPIIVFKVKGVRGPGG